MGIDFLYPIWEYKYMKLQITGGEVEIDDSDLGLISQYRWHVNDMGYAVWRGISNGVKQTIRMHRLIMATPKGLVTDHINHNTLDNRRENLRVCTHSDNMRNKQEQGKGYNWHRQNGSWSVETNGFRMSGFKSEEEAKRVVEVIRNGGTYTRPERVKCKYGHTLKDAYWYNDAKHCKTCQSLRSKEYYRRKKS